MSRNTWSCVVKYGVKSFNFPFQNNKGRPRMEGLC